VLRLHLRRFAAAAMPKAEKEPREAGRATHMQLLKSHGQHFLKNPLIIQGIVEKAGIKASDIVLEIGPGSGNLTAKLLEVARKVIAIEVDARMVAELHKRFQGTELSSKLEIWHGDVLRKDLPYFDLCVANMPYQISAPFMNKLLLHRPHFRCAVLMFQREFALRLVARPGDEQYCRLSTNTQLLAEVQHLMKVGKNNFKPPPKVESSVVRVTPRVPVPDINFLEWDGLLRIVFNRKHKTVGAIFRQRDVVEMLRANYNTFLAMSGSAAPPLVTEEETKERLIAALMDAQMAESRSAALDVDDFLMMLATFNRHGFHFA